MSSSTLLGDSMSYLEIAVVVIKAVKCQTLNREVTHSVGLDHTIRRPQQLHYKERLQRPQFQDHDSYIVGEQQSVGHRHAKLDQLGVSLAGLREDPDSVEQPECHREDKYEENDDGPED